MASTSSDDIEAYLAHLKMATSKGSCSLQVDTKCTDQTAHALSTTSKKTNVASQFVRKSSLKSIPRQDETTQQKLAKYESKYIKSRKSNVAFHLPSEMDTTHSANESESEKPPSDDSVMDDILIQCLKETSLSEENETLLHNVLPAENIQPETVPTRKITAAGPFPTSYPLHSTSLPRKKSIDSKIFSLSEPPEISEGKNISEEITSVNSVASHQSHRSLLLRKKDGVFESSLMRAGDSSSSSSSQKNLSRRISRRNSYVYSGNFDLVSVRSSSEETIRTDSQMGNETDHAASRKKPAEELCELIECESSASESTKINSSSRGSNSSSASQILDEGSEVYKSDFESLSSLDSQSNEENVDTKSDKIDNEICKSKKKSKHVYREDKKSPPSRVKISRSKQKLPRESRRERNEHRGSYCMADTDNAHLSDRGERGATCLCCQKLLDILSNLLQPSHMIPPALHHSGNFFANSLSTGYPFHLQAIVPSPPAQFGIEDSFTRTMLLSREFLLSQRAMFDAYCSSLMSTHRYTTMYQVKKYLKRHNKKSVKKSSSKPAERREREAPVEQTVVTL